MANPKSRLGRGLESLISGSVSPPPRTDAKSTAKPARKTPAKTARKATPKPSPASKPSNAKKSGGATKPPAEPTRPPAPTSSEVPASGPGLREIPVAQVSPSPHQPRRTFSAEALAELSASIRSDGLLPPIVVREKHGAYQLIAGVRRWRACQSLGLKRIPARIVEATETSSAVMSLIENLQRENLNPLEEAQGYARLMADFALTQESIAERVGKARASVANSLRLLHLATEIQQFLAKGLLSVGHAKVLLGIEGHDEQSLLARQIIERRLSVRETERLIQNHRRGATTSHQRASSKDADPASTAAVADLEKRLTQSLSTRVQLKHTPKKGKILIEYYGNEDLQRLLELLGVQG